jgi:hypothetical protein
LYQIMAQLNLNAYRPPWVRLSAGVLLAHVLLLGALVRGDEIWRWSQPQPPQTQRPVVWQAATADSVQLDWVRTIQAPAMPKAQPYRQPPLVVAPAPPAEPQLASYPEPEPEPVVPEPDVSAEPLNVAQAGPFEPLESTGSSELKELVQTGPQGWAFTPPAPLRVSYDVLGTVKGFSYNVSGELLWQPEGERYEARLEIRAFLLGSRRQSSRGRLTAQGLKPVRFADKVRSEVAAHFDYDKHEVIFSANTPRAPLEPGAQDHLSVFVQMAGWIQANPGWFMPGRTFQLQTIGPRDALSWSFTVEGVEQLSLPGGTVDAIKLNRPPAKPYDLRAELWLAPALGYLPARIRLTQDNGDFVDQQWTYSAPP